MKLYVILISLLVGVSIGLPVEDGGIHEDKQNLVIEELQQNLSSIWVQLNELKVNLETHIKETDPQNYYDPSDHGHDHGHDHGADHQHGHQEGEYHGDHHHDYHEHGHHHEGDNYTADAQEGGGNESSGYDQAYDHHHEYDHHHHHHDDYDHHLQHEGTGNTQVHHYDDHHHQDQHHADHQHQDQHHGDHQHQDQHHDDHHRQDQYHGYHRRQDQHHQEGENDDNDHDQDEKDNGSQEDNSEENVDGGASSAKSSYWLQSPRKDSPQSGGEDHHHESGYHHHHQRRLHHKDFLKAKCHLLPNSEVPESNVSGHITISQKKDASGPLYFKIDMKGFTVSPEEGSGYVHGFHIHENPIQEQKCSSAGPHFNPYGKTHGAPYAITRHAGDLGNIRVDDKGRFENQVISDDQVAFFGKNSIIGRSIVVHLKADDFGLGGDEESLKTGNAGARLACCTIESINVPKPVKPIIRFNG